MNRRLEIVLWAVPMLLFYACVGLVMGTCDGVVAWWRHVVGEWR